MQFSGQQIIAANLDQVWSGLNNPEILQQAIPGCQSLEQTADDAFTATVTQSIGPVKATFRGEVSLELTDPPHRYRLHGKANGGVAGRAHGIAEVVLTEQEAQSTLLEYSVTMTINGKLAQIGSRLLDSTSKKLAKQFFDAFSQAVAPKETEPTAETAAEATTVPAIAEIAPKGRKPLWVGIAIAAAAAVGIIGLFLT